MVEMLNYIVSIDIGTSNIVTLVCERDRSGKIRVLSASSVPSQGVARGDVRNVEQVVASILESVSKIEKESNIKICEAYIGLSGEHIRCSLRDGYVFIKNHDSEVTRAHVTELSDSMRNERVSLGQTIIHILPQNYILDGDSDITHPIGMIGKKLEGKFNIVEASRENLSHIERCMNRADIGIKEVILSSLASAEAVLLDDEKELGVMVVDIGGGSCDICIYYDKTVRYMGVIPIGGNFINKDIKSYGILERNVEKLKVRFGNALSDTVSDNVMIRLANVNNIPSKAISEMTLSLIIEARMLDIIEKINDILENTGYKNKLKGPIVLTGGCANLKNIDKLFKKYLDCEVRIASPTIYVTDDSVEHVDDPKFSTAVGLLLKGIVIGLPTKINYYGNVSDNGDSDGSDNSDGYYYPSDRENTPNEEEGEYYTFDRDISGYSSVGYIQGNMASNKYEGVNREVAAASFVSGSNLIADDDSDSSEQAKVNGGNAQNAAKNGNRKTKPRNRNTTVGDIFKNISDFFEPSDIED